jgi:hypothetical protein
MLAFDRVNDSSDSRNQPVRLLEGPIMVVFIMLVFAAMVLIIVTWIYMDIVDMRIQRENDEKRLLKINRQNMKG